MNERRLSECIRAGAAKRPQAYGSMFNEGLGWKLGSCALGAAYEGFFGWPDERNLSLAMSELELEFPILNRRIGSLSVMATIIHMNDSEKLTREEIADVIESIEAQEAVKEMQVERFLTQRNPEPVLA